MPALVNHTLFHDPALQKTKLTSHALINIFSVFCPMKSRILLQNQETEISLPVVLQVRYLLVYQSSPCLPFLQQGLPLLSGLEVLDHPNIIINK